LQVTTEVSKRKSKHTLAMKAISQTLESQILLYDGRRQQNCSTIYRVKNELSHLFFLYCHQCFHEFQVFIVFIFLYYHQCFHFKYLLHLFFILSSMFSWVSNIYCIYFFYTVINAFISSIYCIHFFTMSSML